MTTKQQKIVLLNEPETKTQIAVRLARIMNLHVVDVVDVVGCCVEPIDILGIPYIEDGKVRMTTSNTLCTYIENVR